MAALAWCSVWSTAQIDRPPRENLDRFTVIKAAKVITVSGAEIENGMVVINNDKITQVGRSLEYPRNARVINVPDGVVMPGLIHAGTRAGLPDYNRRGVQAHLTVEQEWIDSAADLSSFLENGFTTLAVTPPGRGFPGQALVMRTGGPDYSSRKLKSPAYIRVAAEKKDIRDAFDKAQEEIDKVAKAREAHEKKQQEAAEAAKKEAEKKPPTTQPATQPATQPTTQPAFEPPKIPPPYQPFVNLIEKKEGVRALFELGGASDYVHLLDALGKREIAYDLLFSSPLFSDLDFILDQLAEHKPRIVLSARTHRLPHSAYVNPLIQRIAEAGCEITLTPIGDGRASLQAHLARVSELVRDGWSREQALKSLTLHPARLLGIEDRLGAVEKDKQADLIILNGDPFAPGATVTHVIIAGKLVHEAPEARRHD